MHFSVGCAFPHLRKRGATSRKGAFCADGLTQKRSLHPPPHGKAHSARPLACRVRPLVRPTRRMRFSVTSRRPGGVGQPPRQAAGRVARVSADLGLSLASRKGALCPTGGLQNALFREGPHTKCAFPWRRRHRMHFSVECAFPHLRKRGAASRKGAFCADGLT